jgi:hypothetical protein
MKAREVTSRFEGENAILQKTRKRRWLWFRTAV